MQTKFVKAATSLQGNLVLMRKAAWAAGVVRITREGV